MVNKIIPAYRRPLINPRDTLEAQLADAARERGRLVAAVMAGVGS
jgi:hypothetical protein